MCKPTFGENCIRCLTLCVLQGLSEEAPPKKDKQEKGNENYNKVKEVRTPVRLC